MGELHAECQCVGVDGWRCRFGCWWMDACGSCTQNARNVSVWMDGAVGSVVGGWMHVGAARRMSVCGCGCGCGWQVCVGAWVLVDGYVWELVDGCM